MTNNVLLAMMLLTLWACGGSDARFYAPPVLQANEMVQWNYNCKKGKSVLVEYAMMGGEYSATIERDDRSKQVLPRLADGGFGNGQWQWLQIDKQGFNLIVEGEVVNSNCKAYSENEQRGIVILRR